MANEIQALATTGLSLYAVILNSTGQAWYTVTPAFEAVNSAHWTSYALTLTEVSGTGIYEGSFPAGITSAGIYSAIAYKKVTGSAAITDPVLAFGPLEWAGAAPAVPVVPNAAGAVTVATNNDKTGYTASTVSDKTGYALTTAEHTLVSGTDVPSALTTQGYTTTRAGYLDTLNGLVAAVWAATTRTLSAFGFTPNVVNVTGTLPSVTVGTNNDKTGYSLTQAFPTNFSVLGIGGTGHITSVDTLTTYSGNTLQTVDGATIKAKTDIMAAALTPTSGVIAAGSSGTTINTGLTAANINSYKGQVIVFTSGALVGQTHLIASNTTGASSVLTTLTAPAVNPTLNDTFTLVTGIGQKTADFLAALGGDSRPKVSGDVHTGNVTIAAVTGTVGSLTAFAFTPNVANVTGTLPNVTVGGYAAAQDPATLVLDGAATSHNVALSVGSKINAAGSGGDPLANAVPGAYGAGTAGAAIGTYLTGNAFTRMGAPTLASIAADINSRLPTSGYTAPTNPTDYQQRGVAVTLPALPNVTVGGYATGQDPATLILAAVVDGGFTMKQMQTLSVAVISGNYTETRNTVAKTITVVYYRPASPGNTTTILATLVTNYSDTALTIPTTRTVTFTNLP